MQLYTTLLAAIMTAGFVAASDVCPPTYCQLGGRCGYDPNGPHCCSGSNDKQVLQCVNGAWAVRNYCGANQFCTCTGSHDLICRTNSKALAESAAAE